MQYRIFYDLTQTWYQDIEAENEEEARELFTEDNENLSEPEFFDTLPDVTIIEIKELENGN